MAPCCCYWSGNIYSLSPQKELVNSIKKKDVKSSNQKKKIVIKLLFMLRATVIARCKYNIFPFRIWSIYSACASPLVSCTYVILRDSQFTDRPLDKTTETLHSFFDLCEAAVGR